MKKTLGRMSRLGIALAIIAGAVFGSASAASAVTLPESAPLASSVSAAAPISAPAVRIVPADDSSDEDTNKKLQSSLAIPMYRWIAGTQSFNFQTDGNPVNAAARGTERTVYYAFPMMAGNTMWTASATLLDGAMRFKPMNLVGYEIDQAAASVGQAIIASPLISLAFVVIALGTVFALKRGERPWRRVWTTSLVAALFAIMVAGSAGSTKNGEDYVPGVGSPGWFLNAISSTTETITSSVAKSLSIPTFSNSDTFSCGKYMATVMASDDTKSSGVMNMASALWVQSGLEAWKKAQFGNSIYAESVYCHVLDWAYPAKAADILDKTGDYPKAVPGSAALSPANGEQRDRSGIAWAVCRWNAGSESWYGITPWFTDDGSGTLRWGKKDSNDTVDGDNQEIKDYADICKKWWDDPASGWNSDPFRVGPNANDTRDFVAGKTGVFPQSDIYTFLTNWHGADNSGIAITFSYSFSSAIVSIVFLVVSGAVFFVNIAIVATMLSIFVVMLVVLFTKNDVETRLVGFVKNLIGLVVFSSVAALLIAMIAKITEVLSKVGNAIFSGMPVAAMVWTGLSPLFALIMLHFVFTKLLRVPSPFKLSSALAWGAAAGAAGGAVGAGVGSAVSRGENRVENAIKSAPGAAGRKIKDAISSKGGSRDGAAAPAGTTKGTDRDGAREDGTKGGPQTAVERRAEAKESKKLAKETRDQEREEKDAGNKKYLGKMDAILSGKGDLPAQTGWRGKFNQANSWISDKTNGALGGAQLSERDYTEDRGIGERIGGKTGSVLSKWGENMSESRAQFAEKWQNNKMGAVKQVAGKTVKYGAIGVAGALTGGGAVVAYAGYRAVKGGSQAARDAGYMGGSQQYRQNAVSALRQQRQQQAQQAQQKNQQPTPQKPPRGSGQKPPAGGNTGAPSGSGQSPKPRA